MQLNMFDSYTILQNTTWHNSLICADPWYAHRVTTDNPGKRQYKVGDHILVKLPVGQIVEVTIRAVIPNAEGTKLQVDWGYDQTALIEEWQVVRE